MIGVLTRLFDINPYFFPKIYFAFTIYHVPNLKVAFFYPGDTEDMETNLVAKTIIKTLIDNHIEIKFQKSWLEEYHHGISKNNVFEQVTFH